MKKRMVTLVMAVILGFSMLSSKVIFAEEDNASLQYNIAQQVNENGSKTLITLTFTQEQLMKIKKVKLPSGAEQIEKLESITYAVSENGVYDFTLYYTENDIEKEEVASVNVSNILEEENDISLYNATTYTVNQSNFDTVVAGIKLSNVSEVELLLQENIIATTAFAGITGKHVTLKSTDQNCFSINMGSEMIGDLTLDNITAFNNNSNIYANGYLFETTANFHSQKDYSGNEVIKSLYGGGSKNNNVLGDTDLRLRGGNFSYVYGGGCDSSVSGSTNVLIDNRNIYIQNLIGGGLAKDTTSGTVGNDVNLVLRQGRIGMSYGGGENQNDYSNREIARVFGDVNITTGYEGAQPYSLLYGSAMTSNGGSIKSTVQNVNMKLLEGTVNFSVNENGSYNGGSGDTQGAGDCDDVLGTITILVNNAKINTLNGSGYLYDNNRKDNYHSRVLNENNEENAVHIIWNNPPELDALNKGETQGIVGTGYQNNNDYVKGNVFIEYINGDLDFIEATQVSDNKDMTKLDGNFHVLMSGGRSAYIRGSLDNYEKSPQEFTSTILFDGCESSEIGYLYYIDEAKLVNSSSILMDSEKFSQFGSLQLPFYSVKNLVITEESKLTTRDSSTKIQKNVTIDNGTWHALGYVYVYEKMISKNGHIFFDNYFALGYNHKNDKDTQFTAIESKNDEFVGLESGCFGQIYGNAKLDNSDLAFMCPVNVSGNWNGGNSILRLPAVVDNYDGTNDGGNIPLNIEGTAKGVTTVYTVSAIDHEVLQKPVLKDNYIAGNNLNNPLQKVFVLGNEDALNEGYYLKRVADPADEENYFMWQIAKNPVYSITYEFISGTKGKELPEEISDLQPVDNKNYVEGATVNAIQPIKTEVKVVDGVWIFNGYDINEKEVTSDIKFTGTWLFMLNASVINHTPIINAEDKLIYIGDTFDPLSDASAFDDEDKDITDKIEVLHNTVDTTKVGVYEVVYKVKDSGGASSIKKIMVTVKENAPLINDDSKVNNVDTKDTTNKGVLMLMVLSSLFLIGIVLCRKEKINNRMK